MRKRRSFDDGRAAESQRERVGATRGPPGRQRHAHEGVGARAAPPADILSLTQHRILWNGATLVSPFGGEPVEDAPPERGVGISAGSPSETPPPEAGACDGDHASR